MPEVSYLIKKNPNRKKVRAVVNEIKANGGYCVSKHERTPETKCHCLRFRETGICECGLFVAIPVVELEPTNGREKRSA